MKIMLLAFIVFIVIGCVNIREKPSDLINDDKMTDLLVDYYLYQQSSGLADVDFDAKEFPKINLAIAEKHGITLNQFQSSIEYYILEDRDGFTEILNSVESKLTDLAPITELDNKVDTAPQEIKEQTPKKQPKNKKQKPERIQLDEKEIDLKKIRQKPFKPINKDSLKIRKAQKDSMLKLKKLKIDKSATPTQL